MKFLVALLMVGAAHAAPAPKGTHWMALKLQVQHPNSYIVDVGPPKGVRMFMVVDVDWTKLCAGYKKHPDKFNYQMWQDAVDLHNELNSLYEIQIDEICDQ
jgi:hypothetical protein